LVAAGIGPGDEVITTPMTFCATVNSIVHAGGTPVLADVNRQTYNIDPEAIEAKITPQTKAIIPVHFAGRSCEMDAIMEIAQRHNLIVIEDCAHAIETEYKGQPAGTFGDYGCFSFYVTKNIVTGEGGMILAKDEEAAQRLKTLGLHGMSKDAWKRFGDSGYKHYQVVQCGFKYNMMDIQAALGIHQLNQVEEFWIRREQIWKFYNESFASLPVEIPAAIEVETRHAYHLYTLMIDESQAGISRDDFLNRMAKQNIGVGVHYVSLPEYEYYQQRFGWHPDDYPNARDIGRQTASIPISAKLSDQDLEDVAAAVRSLCD
jgi:dTDP-4-amino-4,6-dideoxygalactose transaminase